MSSIKITIGYFKKRKSVIFLYIWWERAEIKGSSGKTGPRSNPCQRAAKPPIRGYNSR